VAAARCSSSDPAVWGHTAGTFQRIGAPRLTGHATLAVPYPAACTAAQRVGTRISAASMYHRPLAPPGSNGRFSTIPWRAGRAPVTMVV
jgi:hypothetical protein